MFHFLPHTSSENGKEESPHQETRSSGRAAAAIESRAGIRSRSIRAVQDWNIPGRPSTTRARAPTARAKSACPGEGCSGAPIQGMTPTPFPVCSFQWMRKKTTSSPRSPFRQQMAPSRTRWSHRGGRPLQAGSTRPGAAPAFCQHPRIRVKLPCDGRDRHDVPARPQKRTVGCCCGISWGISRGYMLQFASVPPRFSGVISGLGWGEWDSP